MSRDDWSWLIAGMLLGTGMEQLTRGTTSWWTLMILGNGVCLAFLNRFIILRR